MRARAELAECLAIAGEHDAAADHLSTLLRLNPEDHQGLRYRQMSILLQANRNAEAETLFTQFDESTAQWLYPSVLLALRANNRKLARKRLRAAMRANRRVPAYLTGRRELPPDLPSSYVHGSDDEAVLCAVDLIAPWSDTPDAIAWLRAEIRLTR